MENYTTEDILQELARRSDVENKHTSSKEEKEIYQEMSNIEGIMSYLNQMMNRDVQLYFIASDDNERHQVRGAYARTAYLKGKLIEHNKEKKAGE